LAPLAVLICIQDILPSCGCHISSWFCDSTVIAGTTHQFKQKGDAACGMIALTALFSMLKKTISFPSDIDAIIEEGIKNHQQILGTFMAKDPSLIQLLPEDGHYSFEVCFANCSTAKEELATVNPDFPLGITATLTAGQEKEIYSKLFDKFEKLAEKYGHTLGGIFTLGRETYSITYNPKSSVWAYFNSHGDDIAMNPHRTANLIEFYTTDAWIEFLVQKRCCVYVGNLPLEDINRMIIYPAWLKKKPAPIDRNDL
jgi:hypothetical protein